MDSLAKAVSWTPQSKAVLRFTADEFARIPRIFADNTISHGATGTRRREELLVAGEEGN